MMGKKRDDASARSATNTPMMSDEDLHRISKQHGNASIQGASGASSFSSLSNSDLQIADQYMLLGKALKLKGDYVAAIQEMSKALEIRRKVVGKDHPDTGKFLFLCCVCRLIYL